MNLVNSEPKITKCCLDSTGFKTECIYYHVILNVWQMIHFWMLPSNACILATGLQKYHYYRNLGGRPQWYFEKIVPLHTWFINCSSYRCVTLQALLAYFTISQGPNYYLA